MNYLVRCSLCEGFAPLVASLGGSAPALLAQFQLPTALEQQPDQFVPFRRVVALFEHCAERLSCPDFGIRLAARQGLPMFGPVAVLVRNTFTVHDAFEAIGRYMHVVAPGVRISLDNRLSADFVRLHIAVLDDGLRACRQLLELLMANGTAIARMLTGDPVAAMRMHFPHHRLAPLSVYRAAYGCETWFDQGLCATDISRDLMRRRVIGADRATAEVAREYLESHDTHGAGSLAQQVQLLVRRLLPTGEASLQTIADSLGMHPRTLQRRLDDASLSFGELIDGERRELARHYLGQRDLRLTQIVGLLGYADQSTFNRACRRWFDATPRELRRSSPRD